jgi:hypothetical protein
MKQRFKIGQLVFDKGISRADKVKMYNVMGHYLSDMYKNNPGLASVMIKNKPISKMAMKDVKDMEVKTFKGTSSEIVSVKANGSYSQYTRTIDIAAANMWKIVRDPKLSSKDVAKKFKKFPYDTIDTGYYYKAAGEGFFPSFTVTSNYVPGTIRHEMGHHFHSLGRGGAKKASNDMRRLYDKKSKESKDWFEENLSQYSETNWQEFYAEAFSVYTSPEYEKGKWLPREVEKIFDKLGK